MASANSSSIPVSSLPWGVDISGTSDGLFYGYIVSTVLFGITVVQVWIYVNTNRDKWPLKCLVAMLFLMDLVTTCLGGATLHHYFVANFGNLFNLETIAKVLVYELLVTDVIVFCVEIFFASRVYFMDRTRRVVPFLILFSAFGAFAAGIGSVVEIYGEEFLPGLDSRDNKLALGLNFGLSALSDTIATISLSWSFARSKTGIKRTDVLLQKLLQYTVTRGFSVTVHQVTTLILYLAITPAKFWVLLPFHLSLSKVYVITMVAMLNSRDALHNLANRDGVITDTEICIGSTPGTDGPIRFASQNSGDVGVWRISRIRTHMHRLDVYAASTSSGDLGDTPDTSPSHDGESKVIAASEFPRPQEDEKEKVGDVDVSDTFIEMEELEKKGALITRDISSEVP